MTLRIFVAMLVFGCLMQAQTSPKYHSGEVLQMESVQCVVMAENQPPSAYAATEECQEYVLEGEGVLFHLRSRDAKHPVLLPVGKRAQYRIEDGHLFIRIGKQDREFAVASMEPREPVDAPVKSVKLNHLQ
jgi:hypothetical protein